MNCRAAPNPFQIGDGKIKRPVLTLLGILSLIALVSGRAARSAQTSSAPSYPVARRDFSFGYWLNGWRKSPRDTSADILCIETGYFGLMLDVDDLTRARFGLLDDDVAYGQALQAGAQRLQSLPLAELAIEVRIDGKVYRAVTCKAGIDTHVKRLSSVRLWESGRLVQYFDLLELKFKDAAGHPLPCDGVLDLVAWPGSLTLNVDLTPGSSDQPTEGRGAVGNQEAWTDAQLSVRLTSDEGQWHTEKRITGVWKTGQQQRVALTCHIPGAPVPDERVSIQVSSPGQVWPVTFAGGSNCWTAKVKELQRTWKTGYTDIRDYDEFAIVLENLGRQSTNVPFLLELSRPANITGLCPILCHEEDAAVPRSPNKRKFRTLFEALLDLAI